MIPESYSPLISYSIHPTLECYVKECIYLKSDKFIAVLFWSSFELNVVLISGMTCNCGSHLSGHDVIAGLYCTGIIMVGWFDSEWVSRTNPYSTGDHNARPV